MKHSICIVTGTRADYHLLFPLIRRISDDDRYELKLVVTGAHLKKELGETVRDIEADGVPIEARIPILSDSDSVSDVNLAMSKAFVGFDTYFNQNRPDLLMLLGDRYEMLAVAFVAMNYHIPIAHIAGGETTEGAIDEAIRHAITKMSILHFPICEEYRKRIIQLGEDPDRVFNVGSLGVENALNVDRMSIEELSDSVGIDLSGKFGIFTYHPVTLDEVAVEEQMREILSALDEFSELKIVFTKSNADSGGMRINQMIDEYVSRNPERCMAVYSLGLKRYMSALALADIVIGNSSSGISETPSFGVPTVNIGDRQKGRIQAGNIISCEPSKEDVTQAIRKGLSHEFREEASKVKSPFGDGNTSKKIVEMLDLYLNNTEKYPNIKKFYDIPIK